MANYFPSSLEYPSCNFSVLSSLASQAAQAFQKVTLIVLDAYGSRVMDITMSSTYTPHKVLKTALGLNTNHVAMNIITRKQSANNSVGFECQSCSYEYHYQGDMGSSLEDRPTT